VSWVYLELVLVSLAAMLSPLTLMWSVLVLVLAERPLRNGAWFYLGAVSATLAVGVAAAFVLGDAAASRTPSTPKTWVAVVDVVAGVVLLAWVARVLRRPPNPEKQASMVAQIGKISSASALAVAGAGALLANPGIFIPLGLKTISETDPSSTQYMVEWAFFTFVSLIPLAVALVMLLVVPARAERVLGLARGWLERHATAIGALLVILLALSLLRGGIAGLTD
jgi:hypothetical protein